MSSIPEPGRQVSEAKNVLRRIGRRVDQRSETTRQRIQRLLVSLDAILSTLPEDVPESTLKEVERIVQALHTADQSWNQGQQTSARQSLELAGARIDRLARDLIASIAPP